jgi:hypothetical protein
MNTVIWLADPLGATFVILDNLGWYYAVANIFFRGRKIQIAPWNNRNKNRGIITFRYKNLNYKEYVQFLNRLY